MDKHLHIISFAIPYPPNYGGIIDVFYRIKKLNGLGIKLHLHCFQYDRETSVELNKYCEEVYYYDRKGILTSMFSKAPYIVKSRRSSALKENLLKDEYPIFFEGLHTCTYLSDEDFEDRLKVVRMHNIEWDYYWHLGKVERNMLKRYYFVQEAQKLKKYQDVLRYADKILTVTQADDKYFNAKYGKSFLVPSFHASEAVTSQPGKGKFALYHGNLNVAENNKTAIYLATQVFNNSDIPFVIAGLQPSKTLVSLVKGMKNIELKPNLSASEMAYLIKNAHINVLPTFQATGLKLKLLYALYNGRFVVVNKAMVDNTGLSDLCTIKEEAYKIRGEVERLFNIEFTQQEIDKRAKVLDKLYSNDINAQKVVDLIYNPHLI